MLLLINLTEFENNCQDIFLDLGGGGGGGGGRGGRDND